MKDSARYIKIVEWSEEDQCFVGQCPELIGPCCHGDNEEQVYSELCTIVEEWINLLKLDGKSLPPPTSGRGVVQKMWPNIKGYGHLDIFSPSQVIRYDDV